MLGESGASSEKSEEWSPVDFWEENMPSPLWPYVGLSAPSEGHQEKVNSELLLWDNLKNLPVGVQIPEYEILLTLLSLYTDGGDLHGLKYSKDAFWEK